MKKLFYYTFWDFNNSESNGICKKIMSHVKVFENNGFNVDMSYLIGQDYYLKSDGQETLIQKKHPVWTKYFAERKLCDILKYNKYDCVYIRYSGSEASFIRLLRKFYKDGSKIIIEVPTVEYEAEIEKNLIGLLYKTTDRIYRKKLKKYCTKIVVYQDYDRVFGINTIKTINGLDVEGIKPKRASSSVDINVLCVAIYSMWHGLERFIMGLSEYYDSIPEKKVFLHVVGDGPALLEYKKLVDRYKLNNYVFFYGRKRFDELDYYYNKCDLAIEVLGGHKKGMQISSTIKSREYLARGIPYISEIDTDVISSDWDYLIKVPYDDSPININTIVDYCENILSSKEKKEKATSEIRRYALERIDMSNTMKDIINEFN